MGTKIRKSLKKYNRGISKTVPPSQTLQKALKKIGELKPSLLDRFEQVKADTQIPQYIVYGTDYYMQLVNDMGRVRFAFNSNGKGHFTTEARVSGLMEMAERYSCVKYLFKSPKNAIKASFATKNKYYRLAEFYANPYYPKRVQVLENKDVESAKLLWYKVSTLDDKEGYLPLSLISYTYEYTNGMASGNTFEEALSHGICEVIERHCKIIVREEKLATPTINQASIQSPIIRKLLSKFKALNQKVIVKDFSLGMGIPVIGAIRGKDTGRYFVTVGAAPNREEAMIRALIENSQVEPHGGPHQKHEEGWERSAVLHHLKRTTTINFKALPNLHNIDIKKEIISLKSLLEKQNMQVYYVDTTDPVLRIPSVFVYITNAKRKSSQIGYRNIVIGIIEESLRIKDYQQATKYIRLGEKMDPKNIQLYLFYKGLILAFEKKYTQAVRIFFKLSRTQLYEFQALIDIYIGICYLGLGNPNKAFEYFIANIGRYPTVKFVFMRSHHNFDEELFSDARKLYNRLHSKLVTTTYWCNPCAFVFA